MDLSNAFDTVDKTTLNIKLSELGISDIIHYSTAFINSYMSNRRLCIDKSNEVFKLNYGVPHGSILGLVCKIPLLARRTRPKGQAR